MLAQSGDVAAFQLGVIGRVKAIYADNSPSRGEQCFDKMRADEAGCPGDEVDTIPTHHFPLVTVRAIGPTSWLRVRCRQSATGRQGNLHQ